MATLSLHESRRLVLPIDMLVEAMLQFDRDTGGILWHGTVLDAAIESEPSPCLTIEIQPRGASAAEQRSFNLPAIAAAFIHYCRHARIPLPRNGKKAFEVVPEGLAFCIHNTITMPRLHSSWQQRSPRTQRMVPPVDAPLQESEAMAAV